MDGVDIGMLKVEVRTDYIYLGDLQIHPAYQGQGIGTHLINSILHTATLAKQPVRLRVLKGNPAKAFIPTPRLPRYPNPRSLLYDGMDNITCLMNLLVSTGS